MHTNDTQAGHGKTTNIQIFPNLILTHRSGKFDVGSGRTPEHGTLPRRTLVLPSSTIRKLERWRGEAVDNRHAIAFLKVSGRAARCRAFIQMAIGGPVLSLARFLEQLTRARPGCVDCRSSIETAALHSLGLGKSLAMPNPPRPAYSTPRINSLLRCHRWAMTGHFRSGSLTHD